MNGFENCLFESVELELLLPSAFTLTAVAFKQKLSQQYCGLLCLLYCLYNKHNITWLLGDMEFLFSCSIRYLTRSRIALNTRREIPYLRAPMYYCLHNDKVNNPLDRIVYFNLLSR